MELKRQLELLAHYKKWAGQPIDDRPLLLDLDEFVRFLDAVGETLRSQTGNDLDLESLEADRVAWSRQTFPDATAMGCLEHARKEITEIEEALRQGLPVAVEYADAIMLLLDSAARAGIDCGQVLQAYKDKIEVNKKRSWQKDGDGRYKHVEDEIGPVKSMRDLLEKYPDVDSVTWYRLINTLRGDK